MDLFLRIAFLTESWPHSFVVSLCVAYAYSTGALLSKYTQPAVISGSPFSYRSSVRVVSIAIVRIRVITKHTWWQRLTKSEGNTKSALRQLALQVSQKIHNSTVRTAGVLTPCYRSTIWSEWLMMQETGRAGTLQSRPKEVFEVGSVCEFKRRLNNARLTVFGEDFVWIVELSRWSRGKHSNNCFPL